MKLILYLYTYMELALRQLYTILKSFASMSIKKIRSKTFLLNDGIRNRNTDYFRIYLGGKQGRSRNEINKIA